MTLCQTLEFTTTCRWSYATAMACLTCGLMIGFGTVANAQTIGAGTGILSLPNPNNQVDTPTDGFIDQSRQNVDQSFTATLNPGIYRATTWTFQAGQTGSVIPYLAISTGVDSYQVIAVGSQVDVFGDFGIDITLPFGGNDFTLTSPTEVFAGIVNPTVAGSQNPVFTNINSGGSMDHDNNRDGNMSPAIVGGTVDGFGHANLGRSYAFSIEVELVPEPSTIVLGLLGVMGAFACHRRRSRAR